MVTMMFTRVYPMVSWSSRDIRSRWPGAAAPVPAAPQGNCAGEGASDEDRELQKPAIRQLQVREIDPELEKSDSVAGSEEEDGGPEVVVSLLHRAVPSLKRRDPRKSSSPAASAWY
jgi:hypothetical protein